MKHNYYIYQELYNCLINQYDEREAENIAQILWEDFFHKNKIEKFFLTEENLKLLEECKVKIRNNLPMQYIIGEADFYGYKFKVSKDVLIPRAETEELIYHIINYYKSINYTKISILDIGTGSGCIPITLKKKLKNSEVYALDVSEKALNIARINAERLNTDINFLKADILDTDFKMDTHFNIIVSNPPYIPYSESNLMPNHVLAHEPYLALFVENDNPLIFYERIIQFAHTHLLPNGHLFFETNENNAKDVVNLFKNTNFTRIELIKDMSGKDRIVCAINSSDE